MSDSWFVYMLRCADGSLYTGITKDIVRRVDEHNHDGKLASAYTRSRRPVTLVYQEKCKNRSVASTREAEIKSLSREEKELLLNRK
jgi:putative endonuclease